MENKQFLLAEQTCRLLNEPLPPCCCSHWLTLSSLSIWTNWESFLVIHFFVFTVFTSYLKMKGDSNCPTIFSLSVSALSWCPPTWRTTCRSTASWRALQDSPVTPWTPWATPATPAAVCPTPSRSEIRRTAAWRYTLSAAAASLMPPSSLSPSLYRMRRSQYSCLTGCVCRLPSSKSLANLQKTVNIKENWRGREKSRSSRPPPSARNEDCMLTRLTWLWFLELNIGIIHFSCTLNVIS